MARPGFGGGRFAAARGAPDVAAAVRGLLEPEVPVLEDPARGLDHGAYVPLVAMYPPADIPVLQLSIPGLNPKELFELGKTLAPLRDEGVLIFGSGFLTHNMRYAFRPGVPSWAQEFDAWTADAITRFDVDALMDFQTKAPAANIALPTWEHYAPLLVSAEFAAAVRTPMRSAGRFPLRGVAGEHEVFTPEKGL